MNTISQPQKARPRQIVFPSDPALPHLEVLVNPAGLPKRLAERYGKETGRPVRACFPHYVRYKPGTGCTVGYFLEVEEPAGRESQTLFCYAKQYRETDFALALRKDQTKRWVVPAAGPATFSFPEWGTLVYTYPNDAGLDGLALLARPEKLRPYLERIFKGSSGSFELGKESTFATSVVRYKPERRAVFQCGVRLTDSRTGSEKLVEFYGRAYANRLGEKVHPVLESLSGAFHSNQSFRVPKPLAYFPAEKILFQQAATGKTLEEYLATAQAEELVEKAAGALGRLHVHPVRPSLLPPAVAGNGDLSRVIENLAILSPGLGQKLRALEKKLAVGPPATPRSPAFVHGDFYHTQVLVEPDGLVLLDFDLAHAGDPLEDVGNFLAHLVYATLKKRLTDPEPLSRLFLESYCRCAPWPVDLKGVRWWRSYALLHLAVEPFRRLKPNWPERVEKILQNMEAW